MIQDASDLAVMAEALSQSADCRVLRRLVPRAASQPTTGQDCKTGILLDTETTGLDHARDEIIELGMLKFDYTPDGRIVGVRDTFSAFNEPSGPISAEVTALTGITDEMVASHSFDDAAIAAFVDGAVIAIAHNAGFDRRFVERYWPVFEGMAWGCSATEVDWRKHGLAGAQLGYLLNGVGYFHQAHRAVDDCYALLEILDFTLPTTGSPALALLLETARKKTVRIWAEQSPFELKDSLKRRGYRWSDGTDGRPKSWYVDVGESAVDDELAFLKAEIYLRDVEARLQTLTAFTRFSSRTRVHANEQTMSHQKLKADLPVRHKETVMTDRYDVVVVGSGHNGLIAAAFLAKTGRKVLVLERNALFRSRPTASCWLTAAGSKIAGVIRPAHLNESEQESVLGRTRCSHMLLSYNVVGHRRLRLGAFIVVLFAHNPVRAASIVARNLVPKSSMFAAQGADICSSIDWLINPNK